MRTSWIGRLAACALVLALAPARPARAEDERGRWSFAFGLGVHSTFDDIRNNSAQVVTRESRIDRPPDGDLSNDVVQAFDPRPDDLLARSTKVEEKQRFDFSASYGLTSWLSLQLETGLYRGDVAPLDVMMITERWDEPVGTVDPSTLRNVSEAVSTPMTVGELTQIPVSVNAVIRFRRDSPFNPFLGVGVGYMFNDLQMNGSFDDLNDRILRGFTRVMQVPTSEAADQRINIQQIYAGFVAPENASTAVPAVPVYEVDCTNLGESSPPDLTVTCTPADEAVRFQALPTQPFIVAEVNNAFMYQFSVGADYHFNERWSAFVAARYQVTDANVSVKIRGIDPTLGSFEVNEATFRYIAETNPTPLGVDQEGRFFRTEVSGGDPERARRDTLQERVLVQGGEIDLSAFTVGAGIRFTF